VVSAERVVVGGQRGGLRTPEPIAVKLERRDRLAARKVVMRSRCREDMHGIQDHERVILDTGRHWPTNIVSIIHSRTWIRRRRSVSLDSIERVVSVQLTRHIRHKCFSLIL
jgi:hypothetical protein